MTFGHASGEPLNPPGLVESARRRHPEPPLFQNLRNEVYWLEWTHPNRKEMKQHMERIRELLSRLEEL